MLMAAMAPVRPASAETGSASMDRIIAEVFGGFDATPNEPLAGRARFMACGYVAPALSTPQSDAGSADAALTRMLDWLRVRLRRLGE